MAKTKTSRALKDLAAHRKKGAPGDMRQAFAKDGKRFATLSARLDDLLLDYSKCAVNARTMKLLAALAKETAVAKKRDAMFAGRHHQHHRRPRRPAHRIPQPLQPPGAGGWQGRDAGHQRRARRHGGLCR